MDLLLDAQNIEAWYGDSQALFGVDLQVSPGERVALLGRNGMGKSTTLRTICRLQSRWRGSLLFKGDSLASVPAFVAARRGIALVPEGRRCFVRLDVEENLLVAATQGSWTLESVYALFPALAERRRQNAATLSGGEQQMLSIARALMTNPELLILDEATEGLAPAVRKMIWRSLGALAETGLAILVVDQSLAELGQFASRCVILEKGRSVWQGSPSALSVEVRDRYLGI